MARTAARPDGRDAPVPPVQKLAAASQKRTRLRWARYFRVVTQSSCALGKRTSDEMGARARTPLRVRRHTAFKGRLAQRRPLPCRLTGDTPAAWSSATYRRIPKLSPAPKPGEPSESPALPWTLSLRPRPSCALIPVPICCSSGTSGLRLRA